MGHTEVPLNDLGQDSLAESGEAPSAPGEFPSSARHRWKGVWFPEKQNFPKKAVGVPGPSVPRAPGRVGWSARRCRRGTVSEREAQQRSRSRARAGAGGGSPVGSLSEEGVGPESRPSQGREGKGRWAESRAGKRPVVFFLGGWGIWVNFISFILF